MWLPGLPSYPHQEVSSPSLRQRSGPHSSLGVGGVSVPQASWSVSNGKGSWVTNCTFRHWLLNTSQPLYLVPNGKGHGGPFFHLKQLVMLDFTRDATSVSWTSRQVTGFSRVILLIQFFGFALYLWNITNPQWCRKHWDSFHNYKLLTSEFHAVFSLV